MSGLVELAERVEALSGPDREVDALIRCAVFAPSGAFVRQSPINGAWCVYETGFNGKERSWEPRGLSADQRLGPFTASLDAAMSLVPNDAFWRVGHDGEGGDPSLFLATVFSPQFNRASRPHDAVADTAALALTAAALRARGEVLGRAYSVEGGVES